MHFNTIAAGCMILNGNTVPAGVIPDACVVLGAWLLVEIPNGPLEFD